MSLTFTASASVTGLLLALLFSGFATLVTVSAVEFVFFGLLAPPAVALGVHAAQQRLAPAQTVDRLQLVAVGYLTFLLPLLGATFGLPNGDLGTFAILWGLGAIGGAIWTAPFLAWNHRRRVCSHGTHGTSSSVA